MESRFARWVGVSSIVGAAFFGCTGEILAGPEGGGRGGSSGSGGSPSPARPGEPLPTHAAIDRGRVTLRRLNRVEYNNTVRDLFGSELRPADAWPGDEVDLGFDTVGRAISTSPLHVELMESSSEALVNELFARPPTDPVRAALLSCEDPDSSCVRTILARFLPRAFRRPVDPNVLETWLGLYERLRVEYAHDDALAATLKAILLSPYFLFRIEPEAAPTSSEPLYVDDYSLASRLSYFLWASSPDEELFALASTGALQDEAELMRQLERMLDDPKSDSLVEDFAGQWLFVRAIDQFQPQSDVFPSFDEGLRSSMKRETELFLQDVIARRAPIEEILTAPHTFVDARLAAHYGLLHRGDGFVRASLADSPRRGILSHGSILLVTSPPERSSPVLRGVFVLDQLLCTPPPPPPPNVEAFEAPSSGDGSTLRQRLELHRANPECAGCHDLIDPLGLPLESYDGIGAYRSQDNGQPIDTATILTDGTRVANAAELSSAVAKDPRFSTCMLEQLMTYALGRSFHGPDGVAYVAALRERAATDGGTVDALLRTVVTSEAFRTRRAVAP